MKAYLAGKYTGNRIKITNKLLILHLGNHHTSNEYVIPQMEYDNTSAAELRKQGIKRIHIIYYFGD